MKMEVEAGSSLLHDITKAAARLCVLVCNPFARERWYILDTLEPLNWLETLNWLDTLESLDWLDTLDTFNWLEHPRNGMSTGYIPATG